MEPSSFQCKALHGTGFQKLVLKLFLFPVNKVFVFITKREQTNECLCREKGLCILVEGVKINLAIPQAIRGVIISIEL